jgi:hypothetical protein
MASGARHVMGDAGAVGLVLPVVAFCTLAFLLTHALHLWLIQSELKRER